MTITLTTPTGQIGHRTLAEILAATGEPVRVIARDPAGLDAAVRAKVQVVIGTHNDPNVLDQALPGTDSLFVIVPPGRAGGSNTLERYLAFAGPISAAVRRHGVTQVVAVSSAGHGWPISAGVLTAAFAMDAELERSGASYRALCMPWFMENLLRYTDALRDDNVLPMPYLADRVLPLVAVEDIAHVAAELLCDRAWTGQERRLVFGPDRLTPREMTAIMSEILDRPITYRQTDVNDVAAEAVAAGGPPAFVEDVTAMTNAQNAGIYDEDSAAAQTGCIDFRTWCRHVLRPKLRNA